VVRHSFLVRAALVRAQPFQLGEYSSIRLEYRIVEPMVASSSLVVRLWRCNSVGLEYWIHNPKVAGSNPVTAIRCRAWGKACMVISSKYTQ
jgi:hypothetical protein